MRKAGEEEDWKNKTRDRRGWKRLSDEAVKSCGQREKRKIEILIGFDLEDFWAYVELH